MVTMLKVLLGFKVRTVQTVKLGELNYDKRSVPWKYRLPVAWLSRGNIHSVNSLSTLYAMQVVKSEQERREIAAQMNYPGIKS